MSIENMVFYKSKDEAEMLGQSPIIKVDIWNFKNLDDSTNMDSILETENAVIDKHLRVQFFIPNDDYGIYDIDIAYMEKLRTRRLGLYSFQVTFVEDETSSWEYNFYFSLSLDRQDIVVSAIDFSYKHDPIVLKKNSGLEVTLFLKCSYAPSQNNITNYSDKLEVVTLRSFKHYFDYGKPLTYLANGYKLGKGDLVIVEGENSNQMMVVSESNHILDEKSMVFSIDDLKKVLGIVECKQESDKSLLEIANHIPKDFNFGDKKYYIYKDSIINMKGLINSLNADKISVILIRRPYGQKHYIIGSGGYKLLEDDSIKIDDQEIACIYSQYYETMYCHTSVHVVRANFLINTSEIQFPISRLSFVLSKV